MANSSNLVQQLFLSEKHRHHLIINTSSSSTMEAIEEHLHHHHNEDLPLLEKEEVHHGALKSIKIIPEAKEKEEEEGFKTPTSEQHRIPAMLECPPAPARNKKRRTKHSCFLHRPFQSSLLHYSHQDIETLFPALHHHDHLHGGNNNNNNKNKKIKLS
ncbi:hypothetical protein PIB30_104800 [Stylosanthes scabra]|uniref:Uncharacterized protein n=1 Tax=Stylosanthes scabra TaxID=79078 RepID=A0ABU6YW45_9FABA|nr:hypothetical protein [Stylosanthes scabra]